MLNPRFLTTARHLGLAAALAFGANAWAVPEAQFAPAFEAFSQARSGQASAIDKSVASFTALLAAEPGNPVLLAYLGASTAMQSNTTWLPWKKMNYAEDGLAMLDKALALLTPAHNAALQHAVPAVLEVRFTAANTFLAVPGFMNRSARGAGLLAEVTASPLLAAAPMAFRGDVWLVGLMFALSAAGIDLTALGVLGGALGVGIGLGLQKLAANYVSGFVILAERSMNIGDVVKADGFEGTITDITTRYTVIRALNGRESIVPNEMMITQRIENSSLADPKVAVSTVVQVAYGTDLDVLMPRMQEVVSQVPRVIGDPAPSVLLSNFAADGLELTVAFWIEDPEKGQLAPRSQVNLALLKLFNDLGVEIPFPQRVVRQMPG